MKLTIDEKEFGGKGILKPVKQKTEIKKGTIPPTLEEKNIKVNEDCKSKCLALIIQGKVNREDRLTYSGSSRLALLGKNTDWKSFGELFLGIDESKPEETNLRFTHPVIKNGECYVQALKKYINDDCQELAEAAKELCLKIGISLED